LETFGRLEASQFIVILLFSHDNYNTMSIILAGSLGNTSKPLAELLVKAGHPVTVISGKAARKPDIEAIGAVAAIGSLEDSDFLATVFVGAKAVYAMVPPKHDEPDNTAYYIRIAKSYAQAIRLSGVKKIVLLSGYGADLPNGTGPIVGMHQVEKILSEIDGIFLSTLRVGYFYTNFIHHFKSSIKQAGFIGSNYGGSDRLLLVHASDIAVAASEELLSVPSIDVKIRYVVSDECTADEIAAALGQAINLPDLKWVTFTNEQIVQGMLQRGLPASVAASVAEMGAAIHSGALNAHYDSVPRIQLGKVKLNDYAVEFAVAFNA